MEEWRLIESGAGDACFNMALDEAIALHVREGSSLPTLRLYGWSGPAVSLGMFQAAGDIDMEYCALHDIAVVRRPTGGRAILHGDELTYSVCAQSCGVFSGGLRQTYRAIGNALSRAFSAIGLDVEIARDRRTGRPGRARDPVCFRTVSFAEISCRGHKLAGSAQRRWPESFLQQGSIPFWIDPTMLAGVFGGKEYPHIAGLREIVGRFDPSAFRRVVRESFEQEFSIRCATGYPSVPELERAAQLSQEKYQDPRWLQKIQ